VTPAVQPSAAPKTQIPAGQIEHHEVRVEPQVEIENAKEVIPKRRKAPRLRKFWKRESVDPEAIAAKKAAKAAKKAAKEQSEGGESDRKLPSRFYEPHSTLRDSMEIGFSELTLNKEIGRGAYAIVYHGIWRNCACAIKMLNKVCFNFFESPA
jgi:hypothetical protein